MSTHDGWRAWHHRHSTRLYGPRRATTWLTWVGEERLAVGSLPTGESVLRLAEQGVTHVVNCRATLQTWLSQDLAVERAIFGAARVAHAPMWDFGQNQPPRLWSSAARFAAHTLDDPRARVLVHCQEGRRRSVMLTYAVLRLRGHTAGGAAELILGHRAEAQLVPAYRDSVERWLASSGPSEHRRTNWRARDKQ